MTPLRAVLVHARLALVAWARAFPRALGRAGIGVARIVVREVGLDDVVLVAGIACLSYGVSRWSIPLAWICVGGLLVCLAWPESPPAPPSEGGRPRGD